MISISDILKKTKQKEEKSLSKSPDSEEIKPQTPYQEKEQVEKSGVRISPVVMKRVEIIEDQDTLKLYNEAISLVGEILREDVNYESVEIKKFIMHVEEIVNQLSLDNNKLIALSLSETSIDGNYLAYHSVNVCVLSIQIGLGLGYSKPELVNLGVSALLHDAGITKYMHLVNQARKLTAKEYNEIKNHPIVGSKNLGKIKGLSEEAVHVALQEHERIDGQGYPMGLKGESIHEYAKIVNLVDSYEAMTHSRNYRHKLLPREAIQEILNTKHSFENKLIKILLEKIGLYPVGSLVELNSKEIAQVVKPNHGAPLRPVVSVMYDLSGRELEEPKVINLAEHSTVYIKRVLRKVKLEDAESGNP